MGQWQRQLVVGATGERGDGRSTPPANVTGTSTGSGTAAAALRQGWWPLAAGRWAHLVMATAILQFAFALRSFFEKRPFEPLD